MNRILKIDGFQKANPTKYGLDADGSSYEVELPFDLMIITGYEDIDAGFKSGIKYKKEIWEKIQVNPGDVIMCTKSGSFLIPNGVEGFVECSPMKESGPQEPSFDMFPMDKITKIGKNLYRVKPIPFEERKKMTNYTGI
jgi:hypothetical protein